MRIRSCLLLVALAAVAGGIAGYFLFDALSWLTGSDRKIADAVHVHLVKTEHLSPEAAGDTKVTVETNGSVVTVCIGPRDEGGQDDFQAGLARCADAVRGGSIKTVSDAAFAAADTIEFAIRDHE